MVDNLEKILELLHLEEKALEEIFDYIMRGFTANCDWKSEKKRSESKKQKPKQAKSAKDFWDRCLYEFSLYVDKIKPNSMRYVDCEIDWDKTSFEKGDFNLEKISRPVRIRWISDISKFEESYQNIEKFYLSKSRHVEHCRNLFSELIEYLRAAEELRIGGYNESVKLLEKIKLEYLINIFDLKSVNICKLLPYLLTALCFNYERNHVDSKYLHDFFEYEANCDEAIIIRKRIKKFSQNFSLKSHYKEISYKTDDRPSPIFDLKKTPYIMNAGVLQAVFEKWCEIIPQCAKTARMYRLEKELDLQGCQLLFDYYVQSPEAIKENTSPSR